MRVIFMSFLLLIANSAIAAKVATVTPIAHSMASALLANTSIEVAYLPPTRLPINRIPSWLSRNQTEPMPSFDAIINISSLRPELAFYKPLRSTNVRIVPIDIAQALIPGGEQVAVHSQEEYFWLNSSNALLMLGILKRDLSALWPGQAEHIDNNFQTTSRALRQVALEIDDALLNSGFEVISNANSSVEPFSKGLMLPSLEPEELDGLQAVTIDTQAGDKVWMIDDFSRFSNQGFIARWQAILANIPTH